MRKGMIIAGTILGLLLFLVLALPYLLDLNQYREQYIPLVEKALDRKIEIGHIRLMWFPSLGLHIDHAKIYDDPRMTQEAFVTVSAIEIAVKWTPLFQRRIEVQSLTLHQLNVSIIRTKDEAFNVATLGNQNPTKGEATNTDNSLLGVLGVEQLIISDGTITYQDHSQEQSHTYQLEQFAMKTESVRLGDTAKVSVQAILTSHQIPLSIEGHFGPLKQNFDVPHIEAQLKVGNSNMVAKGQALGGTIDLDLASASIELADLPLNIQLQKPVVLTDVFAHLNMNMTEKAESSSSQRELTVSPFRIQVEMGESILKVTGTAVGEKVQIHGMAPVIHSRDLPVSLSLPRSVSVRHLEVRAQIEGALAHVTALTGEVFDGQFNTKGTWDGRSTVPTFSTRGNLHNIRVGQIQKTLTPASVNLDGTGTMNWNINGTLLPQEPPSLFGQAHVTIMNGQLTGVDLLQRIEQVLKLKYPLSTGSGVTRFSKFQGDVEFSGQEIPIKSVWLEGHDKEFLMKGAGHLTYDQSIRLNGNLRLGNKISRKIIEQMPVAKVALQDGDLVVPFTIKGTLPEPKIGLDFASIQQRVQGEVEKVIQDVLKGDPKDVKEFFKKGKNLLKGLFGK